MLGATHRIVYVVGFPCPRPGPGGPSRRRSRFIGLPPRRGRRQFAHALMLRGAPRRDGYISLSCRARAAYPLRQSRPAGGSLRPQCLRPDLEPARVAPRASAPAPPARGPFLLSVPLLEAKPGRRRLRPLPHAVQRFACTLSDELQPWSPLPLDHSTATTRADPEPTRCTNGLHACSTWVRLTRHCPRARSLRVGVAV